MASQEQSKPASTLGIDTFSLHSLFLSNKNYMHMVIISALAYVLISNMKSYRKTKVWTVQAINARDWLGRKPKRLARMLRLRTMRNKPRKWQPTTGNRFIPLDRSDLILTAKYRQKHWLNLWTKFFFRKKNWTKNSRVFSTQTTPWLRKTSPVSAIRKGSLKSLRMSNISFLILILRGAFNSALEAVTASLDFGTTAVKRIL